MKHRRNKSHVYLPCTKSQIIIIKLVFSVSRVNVYLFNITIFRWREIKECFRICGREQYLNQFILLKRPYLTLSRLSAEPPGVAARRRDEGRSVYHLFHLRCSAPGAGSAPKSNSPWRAPPLASCAGLATGRRTARAMVRNETTLPGPFPSQWPSRRDPAVGGLRGLVSDPGPHTDGQPDGRPGHPVPSERGGAERAPVTCGRGGEAVAPRCDLRPPRLWAVRGGGGGSRPPCRSAPWSCRRVGLG